ncbi:MAG: hypothetical protein ACRDOI_00075 [Trebonia sp.]
MLRLVSALPADRETITINAHTGIPQQLAAGPVGKVTSTVSYLVTRVSLDGIAAGKSKWFYSGTGN